MPLTLLQFEIGPMKNFCYLVGDEKSRKALILDPGWEGDKIINLVEKNGFTLAGLAITHAHYDHTNAILDILSKKDVPVYAQEEEVQYAKKGILIVGDLGSTVKALHQEESLQLGETEVKFIPTPGHTPGSQCVLVESYLLTGDTLFIGGCGRSDLPGGDPALLYKSLKKIASLPSHLVINPGHDYGPEKTRVLSEEIEDNPYLSLPSEDKFIDAVSY